MGRDVGGRLKGAPIFQINGDAGGAEAVVGNAALESGCFGAALDDTEGVDAAHALGRELVGAAARGAEEGSFGVLLQAGRRDVGVEADNCRHPLFCLNDRNSRAWFRTWRS